MEGYTFKRKIFQMLTDAQCRSSKGHAKAYKLTDADGLFLYITHTGHKSWRYRYRIGGKQKQVVLGSYPEVSLRTARDLRDQKKQVLRRGKDPAVEAKRDAHDNEAGEAMAFEAIAREWYAKQVARWRPIHAKDVITSLERDIFPAFGSIALDALDPPTILAVLEQVQNRGAVETGHRLRQRISSIFEYGIAKGLVKLDPAASIGKAMTPKNPGRHWPAVTTIEGAREVLHTTDSAQVSPTVALASRFLALTAQRPGMILWLQWDEIRNVDFGGAGECPHAIWHVSAQKLKLELALSNDGDFDHLVPLCSSAVEVLRTAFKINASSEYVFPGNHSILKPMSENALSDLLKREGFKGIHVPHGWRSTFSTVMNEWSINFGGPEDRMIIDMMLAHRPEGISATELRYNRARYSDRKRQLTEIWSAMLMQGAPAAGQVVLGRRRRRR